MRPPRIVRIGVWALAGVFFGGLYVLICIKDPWYCTYAVGIGYTLGVLDNLRQRNIRKN